MLRPRVHLAPQHQAIKAPRQQPLLQMEPTRAAPARPARPEPPVIRAQSAAAPLTTVLRPQVISQARLAQPAPETMPVATARIRKIRRVQPAMIRWVASRMRPALQRA